MADARLDGTYPQWPNIMANAPLLILDDFGLKALDPGNYMRRALIEKP